MPKTCKKKTKGKRKGEQRVRRLHSRDLWWCSSSTHKPSAASLHPLQQPSIQKSYSSFPARSQSTHWAQVRRKHTSPFSKLKTLCSNLCLLYRPCLWLLIHTDHRCHDLYKCFFSTERIYRAESQSSTLKGPQTVLLDNQECLCINFSM